MFKNHFMGESEPEQYDHDQFPAQFNANRRTSVSAECVAPPSGDSLAMPSLPTSGSTLDKASEQQLRTSLRNVFMFADLSDDALAHILPSFVAKQNPAGSVVIREGDEGDFFYVIQEGEVEYTKDGAHLAESGPGSFFGELALLYNSPRAATVTAKSDLKLWALDRATFKAIIVRKLAFKREHSRLVLSRVDILQDLDSAAQLKIADALQPSTHQAGEVVIREGDEGDNFYLIDEGEAEVTTNGTAVAVLRKGDYFGELALLYNVPRNATVTAKTELKLERLGKLGFERLIGPDVVKQLRERDPTKQ